MDNNGCVKKAVIVPPTSQNQPRIEEDLKTSLIKFGLDKPKDDLQLHAEKVIRNYDPCISCATHFLDLNLIRDGVIENSNQQAEEKPKFKNIKFAKSALIGIGSPMENDQLGWKAIDILQKSEAIQRLKDKGMRLFKLNRPGVLLGENLKNYDHVIIIDAIKPGSSKKQFSWVDINNLDASARKYSSHELGVTESLEWIKAISSLPEDIALLAIAETKEERLVNQVLNCMGLSIDTGT